jgi:hypothetical protein
MADVRSWGGRIVFDQEMARRRDDHRRAGAVSTYFTMGSAPVPVLTVTLS